jgi:hypothetical protein
MDGKREKKGGDAHLDMSLAESPLYLILLSNVEIGLEGWDRQRTLFLNKYILSLEVHGERSIGTQAAKEGGGEIDKPGRNCVLLLGPFNSEPCHFIPARNLCHQGRCRV